ncbi:hypothetical protein R1flu_028667 [Riccia fluitans]|uniref:Uncharacterized protein n=1 Tax=Riccia fluitans TaxID=41844 RepID=A0ABD1XMV4_9MARC
MRNGFWGSPYICLVIEGHLAVEVLAGGLYHVDGVRPEDTVLRPQNFLQDVELADILEEYPKLEELTSRKEFYYRSCNAANYMQYDLRTSAT